MTFKTKTFSLDLPTITAINELSKKKEMNKSQFIKFLVWNYKGRLEVLKQKLNEVK